MKRWWIILGVAAAAAAVFLGVRWNKARSAAAELANLQTEVIQTGPLTATIGATGTVEANQQAALTFQTSGTVEKVFVSLGDHVGRDEVLATLKQTSLPAQVIQAQVELFNAQRALDDLLHSQAARAAAEQALAQARDALKTANYTWSVRQEGRRASDATLDGARANLVIAKDDLDRAKANYDKFSGRRSDDPQRALALAAYADAQRKYDSALRSWNWYTGHPTDIEQALLDADVAVAEARVADAEREWERVKDGPDPQEVAAAQARVAAAEATLELARIAAPFAGTIVSVDVKPGDQVAPGTRAFSLADLSRLTVEVQLSEIDINRVQVGQPVTLNFDAVLDRTYNGTVTEIGLVGMPVQGVVNFPVQVEISDADEAIKPGMTAAVNIVVEQIEDVVLVPNRAVRVREGQRVVYILRDGFPEPVEIKLGATSDLYSEVVDGDVKPGDQIVLNPPSFVFESNGGPPPFMRR